MTFLARLLRFAWRILRNFRRNNGLLMAGALGYNALLSIIPLLALVLILLSTIVDQASLFPAFEAQVDAVFPGRGATVSDAVESFLENREVITGVGLGVMLFFSSIAFRMLEDAMATVFRRDREGKARDRRFWVSAALTVGYLVVSTAAMLALTLAMLAVEHIPEGLRVLGSSVPSAALSVLLLRVSAFAGLVLFLASFYWLMPQVKVNFRRAVVAATVAALLWEGVRSAMSWYFANISLVDAIYGSLATVIIVLVSLEIAAIIVLLGAEILAELERADEADRRWYEPAESG